MKKNPPSMREVNAAEQALREKIREKAKCCGTEPTYEANRAWEKANPSPSERYARKLRAFETALRTKADELLLAGRMGQITSEEFYTKVKAF